MSGPKCYRTPRFTTAVFDGKLQELFACQGRIAAIAELLRAHAERPGAEAIASLLATTEARRVELLAPFKLGDRGEFGEAIRYAFELHIDDRMNALAEHLAALEAVLPPEGTPQASGAPVHSASGAAGIAGVVAGTAAAIPLSAAAALRARVASEVAQRERDFLRRHIVGSLERLGYQSIDEMRVLDFGRPEHHLMRVAGQDNFVGLRFGDDDSLIYRFLVPEAPAALDEAARHRKVEEMEQSCRTFQRVLLELAVLGVPLELERAVPASEEALLQLPERHRAQLGREGQSTAAGTGAAAAAAVAADSGRGAGRR